MRRLRQRFLDGSATEPVEVSGWHRDKRGKLRTVRALRGIDLKVSLNKELWGLAERVANGESPSSTESIVLAT